MNSALRRTLHGALGGAIGAACMTVVRMLAHRTGLIEQMVPQAVEAWANHKVPLGLPVLPSGRAVHHVADQVLHLGMGMGLGSLYGLTLGEGRASLDKVLGYGLGVWVFGSFLLLPALKVMRPEWRASPTEVVVNVSAHLLYAATLALLTEEFEKQSYLQPLGYPLSLTASTG